MRFIFPKIHFSIERWRWNEEYQCWISNKGNFKDDKKRDIKPKVNQDGYLVIKLPKSSRRRAAHRLVMTTWCPIPNSSEMTIDHLDHNKRNNAVSNLEWVTEAENLERAAADFDAEKDAKGNPVPTTNPERIQFKDIHYAAIEVVKRFNIGKGANISTVKNNIKRAAQNGTYYCKQRWFLLDDGKVELLLTRP